ncbi:serine hydrolase-like protein isoform X1 [Anabrus simplex]|uniref:serine hydrolase-like protein isoform X1 n=1 Tax=Anabrus simplex TaxID=316456 RepID=UPI0035A39401
MAELKSDVRNIVGTTTITELKIPVPWGHIAAKAWGDHQSSPVLCLHGLQDNSNTFDHLVPLLPSSFFYLCIDFPGHGQSSHFPPGIILDFLDYVMSIKRVMDYFHWRKANILAHSFGAQLGSYYAALFPHSVSKLIMLDTIAAYCVPTEEYIKRFSYLTDKLLTRERQMSQNNPPSYSYEEAVNRLRSSRFSELTVESANTLVKRSLVSRGNGFGFSTDQRLKSGVWPFLDVKQHMSVLREITCPHLIIAAKDSRPHFEMTLYKNILAMFQRRANFRIVFVEGNHDVHLNHPERVVTYVTKFLLRNTSRL